MEKLLLIDSRVDDLATLIASINTNTTYIVFNYEKSG